jgi:hypothetical protein
MHHGHPSPHSDRLALLSVGAIALVLLAGAAHAQSTTSATPTPSAGTTVSASTSADVGTPAATVQAGAAAQTSTQIASRAALAKEIETKSAAMTAAEIEKQNGKMVDAAHKVDTNASADANADATIAARLAKQFHMDAGAVMAEKQQLDISWGNMVIAHTLSANAKDATSATVENLVGLHKDGMGWGKIAAGLGFKLGPAVAAVEAEGKVAQGQAEASGKVAHIAAAASAHGDPDAAGGDAAHASAEAAAHAAGAAGAALHAGEGLHVGNAGK